MGAGFAFIGQFFLCRIILANAVLLWLIHVVARYERDQVVHLTLLHKLSSAGMTIAMAKPALHLEM